MLGFRSALLQQGLTSRIYWIRKQSMLSVLESPFGHNLVVESISISSLLMDLDMAEREFPSSLTHMVTYK